MLKRHEIQVLRRAGHTWAEVASLTGVSVGTARRVAAEEAVTTVDNAAERAQHHIGRPSKAEAYRDVLVQALTEDPDLRSVELLHRARLAGYTGGKIGVYALAQTLRVHTITPLVRFEGLPGEFRSTTSARCGSPIRTAPAQAALFCVAAEVLALGRGVARGGRARGIARPGRRRASGRLWRHSHL